MQINTMSKKYSYPGFFIALEGPEGSGKSTLAKKLKSYFENHQIDAIFTREPGGTNVEVCQQLRNLLLDHPGLDKKTEVLLFAANRCEHINKLILPALNDNKIVVCDRFVDSSLAYQGFARNNGYKQVLKINQFATSKLVPDLTIFIDVKPEVGLNRIKNNRKNEMNHLDNESLQFHNAVYDGYQKIIKKNKQRYVVIDGNTDPDTILKNVIAAINEKLKKGAYFYHEV